MDMTVQAVNLYIMLSPTS